MREEYIIHQSLDEKTLIKVSAKILTGGRLFIYLIIFLLFVGINFYTDTLNYEDGEIDLVSYIPLVIPFIVVAGIWYSTKKTILKNYKKNPRYYNNITFTLSQESFKIEGKDYHNINQWENYSKIKETRDWFLIYINKYQAHVIDKAQIKDFTMDELKSFFISLKPKIKVSLK
jgi:hypothetical protein